MYVEETCVRLARANTPIRKLVKPEGKVWIYAPKEMVDELAAKNPTTYVSILSAWTTALYNQDFFYIEANGSIHVACPILEKGAINIIEFVGVADEDYIRLLEVRKGSKVTVADWRYNKLETRRLGK